MNFTTAGNKASSVSAREVFRFYRYCWQQDFSSAREGKKRRISRLTGGAEELHSRHPRATVRSKPPASPIPAAHLLLRARQSPLKKGVPQWRTRPSA
jgi:hypothetical protein